jgi:hypothetical protein
VESVFNPGDYFGLADRRPQPLRLVIMLGELVQTTDGKWIIHPPTRCPNGHRLGPGAALVGYQACLGHGRRTHNMDLPQMR